MGVPDGATAEQGNDTTETTTDTTTDTTGGEQPDPGSPADQVSAEIASAEVAGWWRSLFGVGGDQHEAGGGGTGGQFMFASVEELTGVITKWELERDGIMADRNAIAEAYYMIADPASDSMSVSQANASRNSLATMWEHSDQMLKYAENYIAKLYASHKQMTTTEDGVRDSMKSIEV